MDDIHNQNDSLNVFPGISQFCPLASPSVLSNFILGHSKSFLLNMPIFLLLRLEFIWKSVLNTNPRIMYNIGEKFKIRRELGNYLVERSHFIVEET